MTAFPSNSGQEPASQAPRIDVAEGVIRFKPDFTEVYAELDALDRRLDAMDDRFRTLSIGRSANPEPAATSDAPGGIQPLLPDERAEVDREEALVLLRSIEDKLEEFLLQRAGV